MNGILTCELTSFAASTNPKFTPHSSAEHPGVLHVSAAKNAVRTISSLYELPLIVVFSQIYIPGDLSSSYTLKVRALHHIPTYRILTPV